MSARYEYLIFDIGTDPNGAADAERKLDALGSTGWRMVSAVLVQPPKDPDFVRHYMMRETPDT